MFLEGLNSGTFLGRCSMCPVNRKGFRKGCRTAENQAGENERFLRGIGDMSHLHTPQLCTGEQGALGLGPVG